MDREQIETEILACKQLLENTSYVVFRVYEGVSTKEDFADIFAQRAEWWGKLDELEAQLKTASGADRCLA